MNDTALTVIDAPPQPVTARPQTEFAHLAKTPQQVRDDAVAGLTAKAYERASMLELSPEEVAQLQEEFPDEAFKPGANGNENLIYIEHAYLRDRLNKVFGPGRWAIIPRSRWAEDFKTSNGQDASRVYVEGMLMARGCFVAEAVGTMIYFKNNATQDYSDAVEGAKSACLRRCAKELGIGLQAWKKDFCEGWKARRGGHRQPTQQREQHQPQPRQDPPTSQPERSNVAPSGDFTTENVMCEGYKSKNGTAKNGKPWTLHIGTFATDAGSTFEASTFNEALGSKLESLAGSEVCIATKPGRKEGTTELIEISPSDNIPL